MFTVTSGGGTLSITRTMTDANGRAESRFTPLGSGGGTNAVRASVEGISESVTFNDVAADIPDPNLRAAIENALGKAPGIPIAPAEMAALTHLEARNANISDLTGLEFATNLKWLWLDGEEVRTGVWSNSNSVSDLSPLAGLIHLESLDLWKNSVSDISALAGLTNLTHLGLVGNRISDISAVVGLINLESLSLDGNNITDISAVAGLTNLTWLILGSNNISDISPVVGLTNLTRLELGGNSISDISPVAGLPKLTKLFLQGNNISNLSPLVANTGLGSGDQVLLNDNPLSRSSINTHIQTLQSRGVTIEFDDTTHLNIGEPRTVRMIYFLPNDRPYRADMVQRMKDEIRKIQTFYAEQIGAHGYEKITFRVETDPQGKPMVHRVDGRHPNSYYFYHMQSKVHDEIAQTFNLKANIYIIAMDTDVLRRNNGQPMGGTAHRYGKNSGYALVSGEFLWEAVTHELGHAFGLQHNFNDGAYIMSYGPGWNQLSACSAEFLAVHSYFNLDTPIEEGQSPTIKLISSRTYPAGSNSVPIQLKVSDSEGLHQVFLFATTKESHAAGVDQEVKACRGLAGEKDAVVEFDYNGVIPSDGLTSLSSPMVHTIFVEAVDADGNVGWTNFFLFSEALQPLTKISGDNQHGLPNVPLPIPFVVEVRDLNNGLVRRAVPVTFAVIAGGGTLSTTHAITDEKGRAESTLSLGPNLGTTTVEVSAAGIEGLVTFNAVAGAAVDIPDANLRAAIEIAIGVSSGNPIASAEMATLTRMQARNANISDLTGLEFATNLTRLDLGYEKVANEWRNNNAVKDLSPLAGLPHLTWLHLPGNSISDISAVANLPHLTWLHLSNNNISDLSPLVANTGLGEGDKIYVQGNPLSYQSIHTHIPTLQNRGVTVEFDNRTQPALLKISGDNQKGVSGIALRSPFVVEAQDENGSALVGVLVTFAVVTGSGTLRTPNTTTDKNGRAESTLILGPNLGTNTVKVSATGIRGSVIFNATSNYLPTEHLWSIPRGVSLIHVPLKVTTVDGVAQTITSVADLYDALGGVDNVNLLITHDAATQRWHSYLGNMSRDTVADPVLTDDKGIIAVMNNAVSLRLKGDALGTDGSSTLTLYPGLNFVGVPLRDPRITRVKDMFMLEDSVSTITASDNGRFRTANRGLQVNQTRNVNDIPITGGQSFILKAQAAATVIISGDAWYNSAEMATVQPPSIAGIEVKNATPVLVLRGSVVSEDTPVNKEDFRMVVKNLSTGREITTIIGDENFFLPDQVALNPDSIEEVEYQFTLVDTETGRAAMIGDILEISAQFPEPSIGVQPLQYTVTAEDVLRSRIQLAEIVVYEILWETELLANYPNPFTPETWIPYRLSEDAVITLTIHDISGQIIRTLEVGHRTASAYENRSKAIYWDGRNDVGERVASGVYFYTLTAGDFSATRKMLILK